LRNNRILMNTEIKEHFISRWGKYFDRAELPLGFFYTDQLNKEDLEASRVEDRCLIGNLKRVREGYPFVYQRNTSGCSGGKRYTGFSQKLRPKFEYFLSYGIPGEMEGERYKKNPELVKHFLEIIPPFKAPGNYLVFKRLDRLDMSEQPLAVIFFARPDVLAGLFTLANYDRADLYAVITPMGSGCASIINYPLLEARSDDPRCVLGMFDVSARPHVPGDVLTFTVPWQRFEQMVLNLDESFLTTGSWSAVRERI
jgi:uncharacterized protein (DUF169 family)